MCNDGVCAVIQSCGVYVQRGSWYLWCSVWSPVTLWLISLCLVGTVVKLITSTNTKKKNMFVPLSLLSSCLSLTDSTFLTITNKYSIQNTKHHSYIRTKWGVWWFGLNSIMSNFESRPRDIYVANEFQYEVSCNSTTISIHSQWILNEAMNMWLKCKPWLLFWGVEQNTASTVKK